VLYKRATRLFTDLVQARGGGRLPRLLTTLERTRLLIIDDWGPEPLNAEQRRDLLEIVNDRYDRGSLLITSQIPVNRWHEVIGDPTLADAILDRIIHRAHRIELKGPSLRRRPACRGAGPLQVLKTQDSRATPGRPAPARQSTMPTSQIAALKGTGIRTLGPSGRPVVNKRQIEWGVRCSRLVRRSLIRVGFADG
jgi:hypothetical protein